MPPSATTVTLPAVKSTKSPSDDVDLTVIGLSSTSPEKEKDSTASTFCARDLIRIIKPAGDLDPVPADGPAAALASYRTIVTDHMITATWSASGGWSAPELRPYGPLSLDPCASALHYATECFEGLKAYRGYDRRLRLFRPDCNGRRMRDSASRVALPGFEPDEFVGLLKALLQVDAGRWLPRDRVGHHLYLRPTMIGTAAELGIAAAKEAMFYVVLCVMPLLDSPPGGLRLHTSPEDTVRAWAGGFGSAKVGANYGPSLVATREARARGFGQVLWLYGEEGYCTEAGASNLMVVWKKKSGETKETKEKYEEVLEVVTAPLDDRIILDGVTRRSVLELIRTRLGGKAEMVERRYTIGEVMQAAEEGRLVEAFAVGTMYFVCPVSQIHHRGKDVMVPMGEQGEGGEMAVKLKGWLRDIMYGNEAHEWGVVVEEDEQ